MSCVYLIGHLFEPFWVIYELHVLKFAFTGIWTVENYTSSISGAAWKTSVKEIEWQCGAPVKTQLWLVEIWHVSL